MLGQARYLDVLHRTGFSFSIVMRHFERMLTAQPALAGECAAVAASTGAA